MGTIGPGRPEKYSPTTSSGTIPPSAPGLYRIRNRTTGKVEYIGETGSIYRRFREHTRSGKFDLEVHEIEWKCADSTSTSIIRREAEKIWITRYNPPLNRNGGGGGRLVQQPSSELEVEIVTAFIPESPAEGSWAGHNLSPRIREAARTIGNEIKEELIAHAKEGLRNWFQDQRNRFIERSKRKLKNIISPPKPPDDIGQIIEEAPPDAIVEIAYRVEILPFLDTILPYTPRAQLKEGWASATIVGRPVRVILPPSLCNDLLGCNKEVEEVHPANALDVLREAHFDYSEETDRLCQYTSGTQGNK